MDQNHFVIPKKPKLPTAQDYFLLREKGIAYIEELGSATWTDYNAHDPGITILEALCYAMSELGYRIGFDIADILTEENGIIGFKQALFTARRILSNNPLTTNDFRKALIDLPGVRNGWLLCKECACETALYAECKENGLFFAPLWRLRPPRDKDNNPPHEHPVAIRGFYDVLLELDEHPELGDLNDRKVLHTINYELPEAGRLVPLTIEARFPEWQAEMPGVFSRFTGPEASITAVSVTRFSRDRILAEPVDEDSFVQGWRSVFYADYEITFKENDAAPEEVLSLPAAAIRFFSPNQGVKREVVVNTLVEEVLENGGRGGISDKYRRKLVEVSKAVAEARFALHQYRNLCEDFCDIRGVGVDDVAVCADVEVAPEVDIEWVLASIYNEIELYFNPPVPFYMLSELEAEGYSPDEIFDGPPLENGFIKNESLEASEIRSLIHVSDLLNRLMDIPGVLAVKGLILTRYSQNGHPISPSEQWNMTITPGHIPRLYVEASRILFFKNNLPFLPRKDEVMSILAQLRGERERGKIPDSEKDYPIPHGKWNDLADYYPVQHSFPLTYGIGEAGLPESASPMRKAQAKQLKGYLMAYEQLLADMLKQLANTHKLFSTDEQVNRTYFTRYFDPGAPEPAIAGLPNLLNGTATQAALEALAEPAEVFYDRRNRFLDHVLARFGEQFRDYALMLYANADRIAFAPEKLITDKIRFLRFYPRISANRARAFNYRDGSRSCDPRNQAGLAERISRLLGMEMLKSYFSVSIQAVQEGFEATFTLAVPDSGDMLLTSIQPVEAASGEAAEDAAWELIGNVIANSVDAARYTTDTDGNDVLKNDDEEETLIALVAPGKTPAEVIDFTSAILAKERLYIVEHILLRPKFPGDAVFDVCLSDDCNLCGEEDPYSFRMTYVLQGELEPFSYDIDLRRFADTTIRKETPAHILPKICWVGDSKCKNEFSPEELEELAAQCIYPPEGGLCRQFSRFESAWCAWLPLNATFNWKETTRLLYRRVELLLLENAGESYSERQACQCARLLLGYFGNCFKDWINRLVEQELDPTSPEALATMETEVWNKFLEAIAAIRENTSGFCLPPDIDGPEFWEALKNLLLATYEEWVEVSYRLNKLIRIFSKLRSIYPAATLHDCDDGSDDNPVRLDNTILGNL